jgi:hypothetical protein
MSGELRVWIIPGKDPLARNEGQMDLRAELGDLEIRLMDVSLTFAGNQTTIPRDDAILIQLLILDLINRSLRKTGRWITYKMSIIGSNSTVFQPIA